MQHKAATIQNLILLLITLLLVGCAGQVFDDKPAKVVIRIKTSNDLNPDIQGRASPIVLRIYSLKSVDAFNNARFFELYENGQDTLGNDLAGQQELDVSPGQTQQLIEQKLDMATRHIGILAAYRDLDNAVWRGTIDTPLNDTTFVDITLDRLSVSVAEGSKRSKFLKE